MRRVRPADWKPRGVDSLEPAAERVVRSTHHTCVIAGPGAGKTELLAQRASFLLETGRCPHPRRILAISFKRDAARNLRERVARRSGDAASRFDSLTFDAFAKGVLDQFRAALPDHIRPSKDYKIIKPMAQSEAEEFLLAAGPPEAFGGKRAVREASYKDFHQKKVPFASLDVEPKNLVEWSARAIWNGLLHPEPRSQSLLTFGMISRLAGELFRRDERLLRAYRATYTHVFLDEFQDATGLQYWLTKMLVSATAQATAVGDPQQKIMGWAGALEGSFAKFVADFGADQVTLERNHRSCEALAPVVRFIGNRLRGEKDAPVSAAVPTDVCVAREFVDEGAEAAWIASEIAQLVGSGSPPHEIAILVRNKAATYANHVIDELAARGQRARVQDQLQDLLTEPIVAASLLGLRNGNCPPRAALG